MTQNQRVLQHLEEIGPITQYIANEKYGISRLASRISDLKKQGHVICSRYIKVESRYGQTEVKEYRLRGDQSESVS